MKRLSLILCAAIILCFLAGCKKDSAQISEESSVTSSTSEISSVQSLPQEGSTSRTSTADNNNTTVSTTKAVQQTQPTTTLSALENIENSEVVTYYSENPDNKYICAVADKYGVDKSRLIALIRTNAQNPGATVLEFSGKTDSDGQLVKDGNELKAVYEVADSDGTIRKATGKMSGNDGYNFAQSLATFQLTKEFIIPQLDQMKEERTYPE